MIGRLSIVESMGAIMGGLVALGIMWAHAGTNISPWVTYSVVAIVLAIGGNAAMTRLTAVTAGNRTTCRFEDDREPRSGTGEAKGVDVATQLRREGLVQPSENN